MECRLTQLHRDNEEMRLYYVIVCLAVNSSNRNCCKFGAICAHQLGLVEVQYIAPQPYTHTLLADLPPTSMHTILIAFVGVAHVYLELMYIGFCCPSLAHVIGGGHKWSRNPMILLSQYDCRVSNLSRAWCNNPPPPSPKGCFLVGEGANNHIKALKPCLLEDQWGTVPQI